MDDETAEKTGSDNSPEQRADKLKGGAEARIRIGSILLPSAWIYGWRGAFMRVGTRSQARPDERCWLLWFAFLQRLFECWWLGSVPKEMVSQWRKSNDRDSGYQGQRSPSPAEIYAQVTGALSRLEMAGVA
ncbi:unnamed protein product [Fusarium venenatum]|uniref:Uncharacterized protein n=1 Tax=Fusarium venenatum TaxID=56646 RepID=A0A2L2U109_9HYPO|nr:uncharacterized protein FVRRES_08857 [Fusarium venenatum]CEI68780.1 unnamed protein product [Fusarium venenatum]